MEPPAIIVEGLGKQYLLGMGAGPDDLRDALNRRFNALTQRLRLADDRRPTEREAFWALRDVTFSVQRGEILGIIGRNGAGKSTLLKLLSRVTTPTAGRAILSGRVGSLLEVGTGFHPELSGRENTYLNGAILGMSKREIDECYDAIVDYAGIAEFMATPVKRYSSGMHVRLAFAIAAHIRPEILILDEVLAVGDANFQRKSFNTVMDYAGTGNTTLFVSHNLNAVKTMCARAVFLDKGQVRFIGPTGEAIDAYNDSLLMERAESLADRQRQSPALTPLIERVTMRDDAGNETYVVGSCEGIRVRVELRNEAPLTNPYIDLVIRDVFGTRLSWIASGVQQGRLPEVPKNGCMEIIIDEIPFLPGGYQGNIEVGDKGARLDFVGAAFEFQVVHRDIFGTGIQQENARGPLILKSHFDVGISD